MTEKSLIKNNSAKEETFLNSDVRDSSPVIAEA